MKQCYVCNIELLVINCSPTQLKKNGGARCKRCCNNYSKLYYQRHKAKWKRLSIERTRMHSQQNKLKLLSFLENHPCTDCGETDLLVLEFDHTADNKSDNIAVLLYKTQSWDKIMTEISKCEVVCANCHRRRTAKRGNWFKHQQLNKSSILFGPTRA